MNTNPETTELREVVQRTVEMVEQNARDNAYLRGAFEQMNQRFDDSAESINQRFGQVDQRFGQMDQRFDQMDKRIDDLIQLFSYRFEQVDKRFEQIDKRIDDLTQSVNHRFEQMERRFEAVERRISSVEGQFSTQLRWIIGLMAPMYLALIALIIKVFLGS